MTTNPRPEKVAAVQETLAKMSGAQAVFVTEYRGLSVGNMAELRRSTVAAGAETKVVKNTLAALAAREAGLEELVPLLVGPTALTFVTGDIAGVAKAIRTFARANPLLVPTGGVIGTRAIGAAELNALADLPSREVLLAQIAGALQAPMVKTAGLLQAMPRNLAYGINALITQRDAA